MGKPPIPFMHRYGLLSLGVFVAMLIVAEVSRTVERDEAGFIVGGGDLNVFSLQVGDCFDDDSAGRSEITEVEGIPCTDSHDKEVYAVFDIDLVNYPGEEEVFDLTTEACLERFQAFVGREYESSVLDISLIYPTRESFAQLT